MRKTAKRKIPVRRWAYELWRLYTGKILVTLPTDGEKLEEMIQEHGEFTVIVAFVLFILADPPLYHFEPVAHVDTFVSKKGNKIVSTHSDEGAITHFALALFISKADGFVVEAQRTLGDKESLKAFFRDHHGFYELPIIKAIIENLRTTSQQ